MTDYYRTRQGAKVHRAGCWTLKRAPHAIPWNWADGKSLPELIDALRETRGYDPDLAVCGHCFGQREQVTWWWRAQGGEAQGGSR